MQWNTDISMDSDEDITCSQFILMNYSYLVSFTTILPTTSGSGKGTPVCTPSHLITALYLLGFLEPLSLRINECALRSL